MLLCFENFWYTISKVGLWNRSFVVWEITGRKCTVTHGLLAAAFWNIYISQDLGQAHTHIWPCIRFGMWSLWFLEENAAGVNVASRRLYICAKTRHVWSATSAPMWQKWNVGLVYLVTTYGIENHSLYWSGFVTPESNTWNGYKGHLEI